MIGAHTFKCACLRFYYFCLLQLNVKHTENSLRGIEISRTISMARHVTVGLKTAGIDLLGKQAHGSWTHVQNKTAKLIFESGCKVDSLKLEISELNVKRVKRQDVIAVYGLETF